MKTPRWETFSDGVFAIAITLLILEIKVPHEDDLARGLAALWPSLAAYVASFLTIGMWWMSHHTVGDHLRRVDGGVLFLNVLLLMTISFIPFPTAVLADRLGSGIDVGSAAALYAAGQFLPGLIGNAFILYALRRGLLRVEGDFRHFLRLVWIGPTLYALAVPLAFVQPMAALAVFLAVPIVYGLTNVRRRFDEGP